MSQPGETSLLMICYKFPPMQSISCRRTWALYNCLQPYFRHISVISTSNRHILQKTRIDTSGVDIHDAGTRDYRTLLQARRQKHAAASERTKSSWFGRNALKMQTSFPTIRWLGEGGSRYIRNGVRIGEQLIRQHGITHMFSTYPPYADHLIASRLKRKFPHLFWIADFRDLHVDPALDNLYLRGFQLKKNQEILRDADIVTTVSKGLAEHLRRIHPGVEVLRNGISLKHPVTIASDKFTLTYAGSMFQNQRDPTPLLAAIRAAIDNGQIDMQKIRIVYAGKDSAVWQEKVREHRLEHILEDHGFVSEEQAQTLLAETDINILLTYSTPVLKGNLTGKLYDYLAARKPIMVLINGPMDDELQSIIADTRMGIVCAEDTSSQELTRYLTTAYQNWQSGGDTPFHPNMDTLHTLTWEAQISAFARTLNLEMEDVSS